MNLQIFPPSQNAEINANAQEAISEWMFIDEWNEMSGASKELMYAMIGN